MSAAHKAQSPAATGLSADQNLQDTDILATSKQESTLFARFALKGAAVHRLADGGYLVAQWGLSRHVPDLSTLAAFGRVMGVL